MNRDPIVSSLNLHVVLHQDNVDWGLISLSKHVKSVASLKDRCLIVIFKMVIKLLYPFNQAILFSLRNHFDNEFVVIRYKELLLVLLRSLKLSQYSLWQFE